MVFLNGVIIWDHDKYIIKFMYKCLFIITEIGMSNGEQWAPAVAGTSCEFENIRQGHRRLSQIRSFWLGSSTDEPAIGGTRFDYPQYIPDDSGE